MQECLWLIDERYLGLACNERREHANKRLHPIASIADQRCVSVESLSRRIPPLFFSFICWCARGKSKAEVSDVRRINYEMLSEGFENDASDRRARFIVYE